MREFNPKMHAKSMKEQASEMLPNDLSQEDKKYVIDTLYNFTLMSGEAAAHEERPVFTDEQCFMISQVVAEWTFHKCIDLAHSNIPRQYWDNIMQRIAYTVFENIKNGIANNDEQQKVLEKVEQDVSKVWDETINNLNSENVIDKNVTNNAKKLSNFDDYNNNCCKNNVDNEIEEKETWISKLFGFMGMSLYILITGFITVSLPLLIIFLFYRFAKYLSGLSVNIISENWFCQNSICIFIILTWAIISMGFFVARYFDNKIKNKLEELEKVKTELRDLVNPDKMYDRLGVDVLSLQIGSGLLELADPDQEGRLLARVAAFRQQLTDDYGYIMPEIRVMDTAAIEPNEYVIAVRNNVVARGTIYPHKWQINADDLYNAGVTDLSETAIISVVETDENQLIWVDKEDKDNMPKECHFKSDLDVLISHLKEVMLQNVDSIFTINNALKLIEYVKSKNKFLVDSLNSAQITEFDLKIILIELLKNRISIKDIEYIFEKICEVAQRTNEPNVIVEEIKKVLIKN